MVSKLIDVDIGITRVTYQRDFFFSVVEVLVIIKLFIVRIAASIGTDVRGVSILWFVL